NRARRRKENLGKGEIHNGSVPQTHMPFAQSRGAEQCRASGHARLAFLVFAMRPVSWESISTRTELRSCSVLFLSWSIDYLCKRLESRKFSLVVQVSMPVARRGRTATAPDLEANGIMRLSPSPQEAPEVGPGCTRCICHDGPGEAGHFRPSQGKNAAPESL